VVIKLLDNHRNIQVKLMNGLTTIGWVHLVNLVCMLGYFFQIFTSVLIYEYMVNGSLSKFIFVGKERGEC
jgi:hypothetical protein